MMENGPKFRLRDHFLGDEHAYKLLTTLPSPEFFAQLKLLDEDYANAILHCIQCIYSYIAQREYVEDQETFFHHVASAVAFEASQGVLIKGRNHAKKAASIVQMISNTLIAFKDYEPEADKHLDIVNDAEGLLIHHAKIIESVLNTMIDRTTKDYLLEHNHYDCNLMADWTIDAEERARNRRTIHTEKTPVKKTPKKLSAQAHASLHHLKAKRALVFPGQPLIPLHDDMNEDNLSQNGSSDCSEDYTSSGWFSENPSEGYSFGSSSEDEDSLPKTPKTILFRDPSLLNGLEEELKELTMKPKTEAKQAPINYYIKFNK